MARLGADVSGAPSKVSRSTKLPRAESKPVPLQSGSACLTTQRLRRAAELSAWRSSVMMTIGSSLVYGEIAKARSPRDASDKEIAWRSAKLTFGYCAGPNDRFG